MFLRLRCLPFSLKFLLLEHLDVDDPVSVINDAPAEFLQSDALEQLILAVSQIDADFAFEDVAAIEVERRPPGLDLCCVLVLLLPLFLVPIVVFLALRE